MDMATEYIHVKIGLVDGVFPVLEFCTKWPFEGYYHYRSSPHETSWTYKQWCTPCLADGTPLTATDTPQPQHPDKDGESQTVSTDYRKFLSEHWDAEHNHCKVERLDEFYAIFRRAAAAYINKQNHEQENKRQDYKEVHLQHGGNDKRRANEVLYPSVRQRPVPYMPTDKNSVRETGKQVNHEQDKNKSNYQHGAHEPRRADALLHPSGGRGHAPSMPTRDKTGVRTETVAAPRHKPVELSLFPDL